MQAAIAALGKQMGGGALALFTVWVFWSVFSLSGSTQPFAPVLARDRLMRSAGLQQSGVGYLLAAVTPFALNLLPARLLVIGLVVGLVEVSVGTLAVAWIYREQTR